MTRLGHFLFCNVGWVDAQERHGTTVPYENEIFVSNWRAWRIREYTIKKILKNRWDEIFLILFIAYRGAPTPTKRYTALQKCGFSLDFQ